MYFARAREALGIRRARSVVHGARAESCRFWASKQARHLDGHTLLWQRAIRSSVSGADLSDSTLAVPKCMRFSVHNGCSFSALASTLHLGPCMDLLRSCHMLWYASSTRSDTHVDGQSLSRRALNMASLPGFFRLPHSAVTPCTRAGSRLRERGVLPGSGAACSPECRPNRHPAAE